MNGVSWLGIGLLVFLILCCVLPMLLMGRRGRGGMTDKDSQNHSQTKS